MLVGGYDGSTLNDVTKYEEDGTYSELPKLNTARWGAACGAVGQVRRVECKFGLFVTSQVNFTPLHVYIYHRSLRDHSC